MCCWQRRRSQRKDECWQGVDGDPAAVCIVASSVVGLCLHVLGFFVGFYYRVVILL